MNVLIIHGYSDSNKGDLAIVVGMVNGIRAARPDSTITLQSVYSSADPDFAFHHRFVKMMGVKVEQMAVPSPYVDTAGHSVFRNLVAARNLLTTSVAEWLVCTIPTLAKIFPDQDAAIRSTQQCDVVLLKGGQYIYNDQGGFRALLYLWRILHPIYVANRFRRSIVMMGQSVGPLVDDRGRNMVARALTLCETLIVREKKSEKLMQDLGLGSKTELAPDLAFLIQPARPSGLDDVVARLEGGNWLGVTVVNWNFPGEADPQTLKEQYLAALTEVACRVHARTGLEIALFPQVTVKHHGESDLDLLMAFAQRLTAQNVPHLLVTADISPQELSYLYGECSVLLGTRLHSCILAACASTPVVAIRYQGFKTEGIMAELGLADRVFDIAAMDVNGIEAAIFQSYEARASISDQISSRVKTFRAKLMAVLDRVLP